MEKKNDYRIKSQDTGDSLIVNPEVKKAEKRIVQFIENSLKNDSRLDSLEEKYLQKQKHDFILMEAELRNIKKRIELQQQIAKNKKMFLKLEEEMKNHQNEIKRKKREIIQHRLQEMEKKKRQRIQKQSQSHQIIGQIKVKEKKRQIALSKILEKNKEDYEHCYQQALKQRKKLRNAIKFDEIFEHQKKYLENRHKTEIDENLSTIKRLSRESKKYSYRYNRQDSKSQEKPKKFMTIEIQRSERSNRRKNQTKSSIDQYLQTRKKQQKRILQLKEILQKSKQYGNKVEMQYSKNRAKTQSIEARKEKEKLQAEEKEKQITERNKILRKMKKPLLPDQITKNSEGRRHQQIERVIASSTSPEQKMLKLNMMSDTQIRKMKIKGIQSNEQLQRLNKINMMRVKLLLQS